MDRNELRGKLLRLSKPAIVAGYNEVLFFHPEEVLRAALKAEWEMECAKEQGASAKALEYTTLAEQRAIKGEYGGSRAAYDAAREAHRKAMMHTRRAGRLYKEMMATFEE